MPLTSGMNARERYQALRRSWLIDLANSGYAANTVRTYGKALDSLADWLYLARVEPHEATREQIRGWVADYRRKTSSGSARSMLPGIRSFYRWLITEDERSDDPCKSVAMPPPNPTVTECLAVEDIQRLLSTCAGPDFVSRRDRAIIYVFADGGLRLAEVADLRYGDWIGSSRTLIVNGKAANRSGPRRRAIRLGNRAGQAMDRYVRSRLTHVCAASDMLWLGAGIRAHVSYGGIKAMLNRRADLVGLNVHPHQFRHTWASQFRKNGGSEGDLMVMGGWHSRAMLDRYGKADAEERARDAYSRISLGDRL